MISSLGRLGSVVGTIRDLFLLLAHFVHLAPQAEHILATQLVYETRSKIIAVNLTKCNI